jgi:2'-hydroxyisoflavone reductase
VTGGGAELVWVDPEAIEAAGIDRWASLPGWVPPGGEVAGLSAGNVDRAYATGLRPRPTAETVADVWDWVVAEGRELRGEGLHLGPEVELSVIEDWLARRRYPADGTRSRGPGSRERDPDRPGSHVGERNPPAG